MIRFWLHQVSLLGRTWLLVPLEPLEPLRVNGCKVPNPSLANVQCHQS